MIPCKDCLVLGICKGIVSDAKGRLTIYQEIVEHVETIMPLSKKYKGILTQQSVFSIVERLAIRCSLLEEYMMDDEEIQDEHYWSIIHFYNIEQYQGE